MKTRFFACVSISVLLLNVVGFGAFDTRTALAKKRQATRLVSLLPASDGIAVFDSKRFLNDALPQLLSLGSFGNMRLRPGRGQDPFSAIGWVHERSIRRVASA